MCLWQGDACIARALRRVGILGIESHTGTARIGDHKVERVITVMAHILPLNPAARPAVLVYSYMRLSFCLSAPTHCKTSYVSLHSASEHAQSRAACPVDELPLFVCSRFNPLLVLIDSGCCLGWWPRTGMVQVRAR